MKKQKTLQNLIDEIVNWGFDDKIGKMTEMDLSEAEKMRKKIKSFLRQSLLKIAQVTAEVGRIDYKRHITTIEKLDNQASGFNQAVQQQQNQLKEFLGEYYDKKTKND